MDFDWSHPSFELDRSLSRREIEESFEDPFAVRLLPDSSKGKGILSLYRTNGRQVRVIYARPFAAEERFFYGRKMDEALHGRASPAAQ